MKEKTIRITAIAMPRATLRKMKPNTSVRISTRDVKTASLRIIASNLKHEGYLFRVSNRGLRDATIVECLKTPEL